MRPSPPSLASISVTAAASAWAHHRRGGVDARALAWLTPGADPRQRRRALVVAGISQLTDGVCRQFLSAGRLADQRPRAEQAGNLLERPMPSARLAPGGLVIGAVSAAGIGGGSLTVPLLYRLRERCRASHRHFGSRRFSPIALAGTVGYRFADTPAALSRWAIGLVDLKLALAIASPSILTALLGAACWPTGCRWHASADFALWLLVVAGLLVYRLSRADPGWLIRTAPAPPCTRPRRDCPCRPPAWPQPAVPMALLDALTASAMAFPDHCCRQRPILSISALTLPQTLLDRPLHPGRGEPPHGNRDGDDDDDPLCPLRRSPG